MNDHTLPVLAACVASIASALPCQVVTTQLSAATPLNMHCVAGAATDQATLPIGAMPPSGFIAAVLPGPSILQATAYAQLSWGSQSDVAHAEVLLRQALVVYPVAQGAADAGGEVVVEFAAPVATPVEIDAELFAALSPGVPWPLIAIDVGNDGTIEITGIQMTTGPFPLATTTLGTQPLQVRIVFASQLPGAGNSLTALTLTARPYNDVHSVRNVLGCGTAFMTDPVPIFTNRGVAVGGDAQFYVVGLSMQPLLLQPAPYPASIPWPCLVMPAPDIVVFSLTGLQIPLPAAVRPVTFHVQGVFVSPANGLWTTDGYTVTAQ